jgi:hypothetical protein
MSNWTGTALAVAVFGASLTVAIPAAAQGPKAKAAAAQGNAAAAAPVQPIVALRATIQLLQQADHDYKGHRVKAIQHIRNAILALEPVKPTKAAKAGPLAKAQAKGKGIRMPEPQAVSDAQLRQAQQQLQAIAQVMSATPGAANAKVLGEIGSALKELQTALAIR